MNELDAARQAILNEEEGAAFYSLAADNTSNPDAKEAFLSLKDQELKHAEWLRSLYNRLISTSSITNLEWETLAEIEFNRNAELKKRGVSPKIFSQAGTTFKFAVTELSVYAAGILMEKDSMEFYQKAAANAESLEAKKLFETLAEWEKGHFDELTAIHTALKEYWLEQQDFYESPQL